jgi:hypothetical protein
VHPAALQQQLVWLRLQLVHLAEKVLAVVVELQLFRIVAYRMSEQQLVQRTAV